MKQRDWSKFFCVILIAVLLTSVFGCKQKEQAKATATPTQAGTTNVAATATQTPSVTQIPPIDLNGRTINVFSQFGDQFFVGGGKIGLATKVMSTQTDEDKKILARIEKVQSDYNCKIKFVGQQSSQAWDKIVSTALSGSPIGDFGYVGSYYIYGNLNKYGAFLALDNFNDILKLDDTSRWNVTIDKSIFTYQGMRLAVTKRYTGFEAVNGGYVMYFNKSMLIRENLWNKYNLYDMQNKKTWNWNTFADLCKKVTKDTNSDGEADQVGCNYSEFLLRGLMHTNTPTNGNGGWVNIQSDGTAKVVIGDKYHKPAIEFLANLYKQGVMKGEDSGSGTTEESIRMFTKGIVAFDVDYGNRINIMKSSKMADTWGVVALPLAPSGHKDYILPISGYFPYVIARNVSKPKEVATIMSVLLPPQTSSAEEETVAAEAQLSNYIGKETQTIDTFHMLSEPERFSTDVDGTFLGFIGIPMWIFYFNMKTAIEGTVTVEQLLQMSMPKIQTTINDTWMSIQKGAKKMKKDIDSGKQIG